MRPEQARHPAEATHMSALDRFAASFEIQGPGENGERRAIRMRPAPQGGPFSDFRAQVLGRADGNEGDEAVGGVAHKGERGPVSPEAGDE